jgi:NAD(P)-dependent dehydrogenase (short-subunit alcohol dehydrogenase family)
VLLDGKRIIVTGGVTGIGRASVIGMVREGAQVVSMSRKSPDDDGVKAVMSAAADLGPGPAMHLKCDVSDQSAVNAAFSEAIEAMGGLDVLVNCAGWETQEPAEDLTLQHLEAMFAVNVWGTVFTNGAACRHYKTVGGGVIINYASYAGVCGMPGMASYSAAKGAVVAFTRSIAKDWARQYNIRSNLVCPGVMTELAEKFFDEMEPERLAQITAWQQATILLGGKPGEAEDAANLTIFLASDLGKFVHGQTIGVDGGMMMSR